MCIKVLVFDELIWVILNSKCSKCLLERNLNAKPGGWFVPRYNVKANRASVSAAVNEIWFAKETIGAYYKRCIIGCLLQW